ncbi:hypothetical protein RMATCC62417_13019 [Rhizopus microsporus]|nr:hypothetical protein RMATCC62417_13019 [Rhizopus microsporus]
MASYERVLGDEEGELSSQLTKETLLNTVENKHLTSAYASFGIARKYNHMLIFTPPYHCELQHIEIVWSMVKGLVAYSPDLHEAVRNLKEKLDTALRNIDEESYFDLEEVMQTVVFMASKN